MSKIQFDEYRLETVCKVLIKFNKAVSSTFKDWESLADYIRTRSDHYFEEKQTWWGVYGFNVNVYWNGTQWRAITTLEAHIFS